MRITSFNILNGGTGRADPLAEIILAQRSDIVCLLETHDEAVVSRIASRLKMDFFRAGDQQQAATILSRWPIRETIDHAAIRPEISKSFVEAVVIEPGGREWPIAVVHLHAHAFEADEETRLRELSIVLEILGHHRAEDRPHLLAGDFNSNSPHQQIEIEKCTPTTREAFIANGGEIPRRVVQRILDAGYRDSLYEFDRARGSDEATFTTLHPGQRVDYIFTFNCEPIHSAWIEHDRLARFASDHYPVGAEIGSNAAADAGVR